jgi:hypothetical protein
MKLFLHAGTEKTGSSHIQTQCVNGREQLQDSGIWFPEGIPRHERRMQAGLVSAGNAFAISERGREGDHDGVLAELIRHRKTAQSHNCRAVFLTSELLLPYCANDDAWLGLFENCRRSGFDSVSTLVILRDPVDQLISLYKHRARSGKAGRLNDWVSEGYRLPGDLEQLRKQAGVDGVELTARGYTRRPGGLEDIFFRDWLNIQPPNSTTDGEVNPSLSLSELELIRLIQARRPELVTPLFEKLVAVPRSSKSQSGVVERYARALAELEAWRSREEWHEWNKLLPEHEKLRVPEAEPTLPSQAIEATFSHLQVKAIAAFMSERLKPSSHMKLAWSSSMRPLLARLRRRLTQLS